MSLLSWLPRKEQGLELWGEGLGGSCVVLPSALFSSHQVPGELLSGMLACVVTNVLGTAVGHRWHFPGSQERAGEPCTSLGESWTTLPFPE